MKILVISDTHFMAGSMVVDIYQNCPVKVDALIHCGDYCQDERELASISNLYLVAGNNDFKIPQKELMLTFDNKKIFVTHGHIYDIEYHHRYLIEEGLERNVDIILYGHTHTPFKQVLDGMLVINPGSPCIPRGFGRTPTYCVLDTENLIVTYYHAKTHERLDLWGEGEDLPISLVKKEIKKEPEIVVEKKESFFSKLKKMFKE